MWGTSSNYPTIKNYGDARRLYENTTPLRGKPNFRPIGARSSRTEAQIEKHGDTYSIRLYNTTIISYEPDGSFWVNHGNWCSQTTAGAISAMSPCTAWVSKGNFAVSAGRSGYAEDKRFIVPSGGLRFNRNEDGSYVPVNPPVATQTKQRVLKDKAKAARAYFKEVPVLIKALTAMLKGTEVQRGLSHRPLMILFNEGGELSGEEASRIALCFVHGACSWGYEGYSLWGDAAKTTMSFWREVYQALSINETYEVQLPYGEVA